MKKEKIKKDKKKILKSESVDKTKNHMMIFVCLISFILLVMIIVSYFNMYTKPVVSDPVVARSNELVYLSDIPYVSEQSNVGWGSITIDQNVDKSDMISLIVNGKRKYFLKGIGAHATSNVVFDISDYDYDYFSVYYGVDASRGTASDGVKMHIFTSVDGENWDLETLNSPPIKKGDTEAEFTKLSIKGKKYIKLFCRQYGNATSDHCVYGDAKLYKEGYEESIKTSVDFIKTIEEYDNELRGLSLEEQLNSKELVLLQRELVSRIGYDLLQNLATLDTDYEDTLRWLMTDLDNMRLYIHGGKPTGSYTNSIKVLTRLHKAYRNDFNVNTISKFGNNVGDLYKRMAISLSLTHSAQVALWMQPSEPSNQSDAVERYRIFKKMYDEGKFKVNDSIDITPWFESYTVEEMRFVMNNIIDDESILWLHDYTQSQIEAHPNQAWTYLTPHPYMAYVYPNYGNAVFHDPTRKDYWDNKFGGVFSKYGVTYTSGPNKVYKVWMNFRNEFGTGAVCGGISKTGSNIRTVHGIPAAVIGQPGHAAIIYYSQNSSGQGYWNLDNDVSGWTLSEKSERMLIGWGNDRRYAKGYTIPYMQAAQEALNRYDNFQKSHEILMLSKIYDNNLQKKEEYLWAALDELDFNLDVWFELISLYNSDSSKTEEDYFNLANRLSVALLEYPLPYSQLMALISPHMTTNAYKFNYSLLLQDTLVKGKNYNGSDVVQPSLTKLMANYLLGKTDTTLASFSFNGVDAGKIVLASRFDGSGVRWDYSLDGKNSWNEVSFTGNEEHKYLLTRDEIDSITADNDIYIHIVGAPYNDQNILKIDIVNNVINESSYFRNDLENRVMGVNLNHEWRNSDSEEWTSYATKSPDNTGNKTLQVRMGANGTKLASNVLTFNFTEDNQPDNRKYIPVSHLSVHAVSTEAVNNGGSAIYAIDGNYNTRYHSAWNGTDTERYITIKLDHPVVLTAVEFVPAGGGNGKIYDGTIYGSMDGENWEVLSSQTNLRYSNQANSNDDAIRNTKSFEIDNPRQVQYVKIVADRTNGNWFAARAFNFYEDFTRNPNPTASVGFDVTAPTNGNVVARLINPSTNIRVTNNGGSDTYTFTQNGNFTFEFIDDSNGMTGSATATVNWIDKEVPTASVRYNITSKTNKEVLATLVPSEDIVVLNNGDYESDNPNSDPMTHLFMDNGEFTFEFRDKAGNIGTATAKVDWIDLDVPTGNLTYSTTELTNEDVTVSIYFDKENVRVTNNNGNTDYVFTENGEFTFEFVDEAGNVGTKTAYVNWIDKVAPNAQIFYNPSDATTGPVTATIYSNEEITVINNGGSEIYTFTENGSFEFIYEDILGNKGKITAKVTWIKGESSNPGSPNEPNNPGSSTQNPGGSEKPGESPSNPDNSGDVTPPKVEYKEFSINNIKLSVPKDDLTDDLVLKESRFIVSNELMKRFNSNSEFFEIYLMNSNNEKVNLSSKVKMIIELDTTREFIGIFELKNNNLVESLDFRTIGKNKIEVETNNLGKFIIHYKGDNDVVVPEEKKHSNVIWFILLGIVGIIGVISLIVRKRKVDLDKKGREQI